MENPLGSTEGTWLNFWIQPTDIGSCTGSTRGLLWVLASATDAHGLSAIGPF